MTQQALDKQHDIIVVHHGIMLHVVAESAKSHAPRLLQCLAMKWNV